MNRAAGPARRRRSASDTSVFRDVALVVLGTALAALSFNLLLRPNQIAPGGLPGLSLLLERAAGVSPALSQVVLNAAFLALAGPLLGRGFVTRSVLGSLLLPLFIWLTRDWPALTHERMLAVFCGGPALGAGLGLVFHGRGSVGGFSAVAAVLHRRFGLPVDRALLVLDGTVVALAATVFPAEAALGALLCAYLISRTARATLTGFSNAQVALIVARNAPVIREAVLRQLDLGLTTLAGRGGHTGEPREVLMVVMRPADVPRLKATVHALDREAFVILAEASEVLGYGFKPPP